MKKKEGKENFGSGYAAKGVCLYLQNVERVEILPKSLLFGGVAQLGEHLPCKQGVSGSIPLISTKSGKAGDTECNNKMGS